MSLRINSDLKDIFKVTCLILAAVIIILIGESGLAVPLYRANNTNSVIIIEWGYARNITNNIGKDLFIPTNTSAEFLSFINYPPSGANVTIVKVLSLTGTSRRWSDGSNATTCKQYKNPLAGYIYAGDTGDGIYMIDPDGAGAGAPYEAYCNMGLQGGGWTRCAAERIYYSAGESKTITHGFLSEVKNLSSVYNDGNSLSRNGMTVVKTGRASGANIEDKCGPSTSFATSEVMILDREKGNGGYGTRDYFFYFILKSPETWPFSRSTATAQTDCYNSGFVSSKWDKYNSTYGLLGTDWTTVNWAAGDGRSYDAPSYCGYYSNTGTAILDMTAGQNRFIFGEVPGASSWGNNLLGYCVGCAAADSVSTESSGYAADESNKASYYNTFTVGAGYTYFKLVKEFYVR